MRQNSSLNAMLLPVKTLIASLLEGMTLLSGYVLLAGTRGGAGHARTPPSYFIPGNEVIIQAPSIGTLRNQMGTNLGSLAAY